MKAIVQDTYGSADVLRLEEVPVPSIGDREVLLRVRAAGVDPGVWHLMTGRPHLVRAVYGLRKPRQRIRGFGVAGEVESVGSGVSGLQPGDLVMGVGDGTFAEFAACKHDKLVPKPVNASFEQAASVPVSATTALQAVRDKGRAAEGQRVLIIGASGGVGSFAVQIGKAYGADVTGVCGTSGVDFVRALGADHVIDYTQEEVGEGGNRYDLIIDNGGNRPLSVLRRALTPNGTLVLVGGEAGGNWLGGIDRNLRAAVTTPFVKQRLTAFVARERAEDLATLRDMIEAGTVTPQVDRTFPLSEAAEALRYMETGHPRGKVALTV